VLLKIVKDGGRLHLEAQSDRRYNPVAVTLDNEQTRLLINMLETAWKATAFEFAYEFAATVTEEHNGEPQTPTQGKTLPGKAAGKTPASKATGKQTAKSA
jgi:hypothetical protein